MTRKTTPPPTGGTLSDRPRVFNPGPPRHPAGGWARGGKVKGGRPPLFPGRTGGR